MPPLQGFMKKLVSVALPQAFTSRSFGAFLSASKNQIHPALERKQIVMKKSEDRISMAAALAAHELRRSVSARLISFCVATLWLLVLTPYCFRVNDVLAANLLREADRIYHQEAMMTENARTATQRRSRRTKRRQSRPASGRAPERPAINRQSPVINVEGDAGINRKIYPADVEVLPDVPLPSSVPECDRQRDADHKKNRQAEEFEEALYQENMKKFQSKPRMIEIEVERHAGMTLRIEEEARAIAERHRQCVQRHSAPKPGSQR